MRKVFVCLLVAACLGAGGVEALEPLAADGAAAAKRPAAAERCAPETGSRISRAPRPDGRCEPKAAGLRSYSKEDLEQSGEVDLDRALSQLDPSIGRGGRAAPGVR